MIARVARFRGQPDRFTSGHAFRYVLEACQAVPGFVTGYHLAGGEDSLSVTVWLTEEAMQAGEAAVAEARRRLQLPGSPPDFVETFRVVNERGA